MSRIHRRGEIVAYESSYSSRWLKEPMISNNQQLLSATYKYDNKILIYFFTIKLRYIIC